MAASKDLVARPVRVGESGFFAAPIALFAQNAKHPSRWLGLKGYVALLSALAS